jgi:hypothetical protein
MEQSKEQLLRYRQQLVERYGQQPQELRAAVLARGEAGLHKPLAKGEWSPHQVLVHVAAAEAYAFLPRLKRIAVEDQPELPSWDETSWMESNYNAEADSETWFGTFEAARREDHLNQLQLPEELRPQRKE